MVGERTSRALTRIEAAAGRIEAAAQRPSPVSGDPEMAAKYAALRREAGAVLAELDGLIGSLER